MVEVKHLARKIAGIRERIRGGEIGLICDDMRTHKVLDALLGGEKIDSGSFGNPGGLANLCTLAPFKVGILDDAEQKSRLAQITTDLRAGVYRFMAEKIKPGGRLHLYERAYFDGPPKGEDVLQTVRNIMGPEARYWKDPQIRIAKAIILNLNEVGSGITWHSHQDEAASLEASQDPLVLFTCSLERTAEAS
jgi:hypothetical protein